MILNWSTAEAVEYSNLKAHVHHIYTYPCHPLQHGVCLLVKRIVARLNTGTTLNMFKSAVLAAATFGTASAADLHRAPVGDAIEGEFIVRLRDGDEVKARVEGTLQ